MPFSPISKGRLSHSQNIKIRVVGLHPHKSATKKTHTVSKSFETTPGVPDLMWGKGDNRWWKQRKCHRLKVYRLQSIRRVWWSHASNPFQILHGYGTFLQCRNLCSEILLPYGFHSCWYIQIWNPNQDSPRCKRSFWNAPPITLTFKQWAPKRITIFWILKQYSCQDVRFSCTGWKRSFKAKCETSLEFLALDPLLPLQSFWCSKRISASHLEHWIFTHHRITAVLLQILNYTDRKMHGEDIHPYRTWRRNLETRNDIQSKDAHERYTAVENDHWGWYYVKVYSRSSRQKLIRIYTNVQEEGNS